MKKLIKSLFLVKVGAAALILLWVQSLTGQSQGEYFILQTGTHNISLNSYQDNQIQQEDVYPMSSNSIYATDGVEYTAVMERDNNLLKVYSLKKNDVVEKDIPSIMRVRAILVHNGSVFLGGFIDGTSIVRMDIESKEVTPVTMPEAPDFLHRKAIDDFVIDGDMLLAIDNIVTPKFIIYFHLYSGNRTEYSHYVELKNNGSYEEIKSGKICNDYIATLSYSGGQGGGFSHVTVYDKENMPSSFSVYGRLSPPIFAREGDEYGTNRFTDFVIYRDKVIISSVEKGLGVLDIELDYFGSRERLNQKIDYEKMKVSLESDEIIFNLTLIPGTGNVVVSIVDQTESIRHQVLQL